MAMAVTCLESMLATQGFQQLPAIVYSICSIAAHYHAATREDDCGWMAHKCTSGSLCYQNGWKKRIFHNIRLPMPWPHRHHEPLTHTTPCTLAYICIVQQKPWLNLQSARSHCIGAFAHSNQLQQTAVRSRPRWGWRACKWASLRQFLHLLFYKKKEFNSCLDGWPQRWRCWMWRSRAGVVTCGLRLWGRLDVLPNSLKCLWTRHFNGKSLKTSNICCVMKHWPFIVASLRRTCATIMQSTAVGWMNYLGKGAYSHRFRQMFRQYLK